MFTGAVIGRIDAVPDDNEHSDVLGLAFDDRVGGQRGAQVYPLHIGLSRVPQNVFDRSFNGLDKVPSIGRYLARSQYPAFVYQYRIGMSSSHVKAEIHDHPLMVS
jgi:hypothetical protein